MPPSFCLIPQHAARFLAAIRSGTIDGAKLAGMTSEDRHAVFAGVVGEANAAHLNAAFESKLLLRNQQQGIVNWVKQVTGISPDVRKDLLARVGRMDSRVLEPAALNSFLSDLAAQRLGFGVSMQEAGTIAQLAKDVSLTKANVATDRMAYGRARVAFGNYVADLKNAVPTPRTAGSTLTDVAGFSKSIKASFDNSAIFRQGWKTLFSHPEIWQKNARQSFVDMVQQFGGKEVLDEVNADVVSRPNSLNGRYQKAGLAISNVEEAFPTTLPEKVPVLGRAHKASEAAFVGFQYRMRADVFDKYMEIAQHSGVDLSDKTELESIGKLVNSLTARGHLGAKLEPAAPALNVAFFSPRMLKSNIDFLTAHQLQAGVTPFVRKQAAVNLVKVVSGTAAILAVANAVAPGSVEWDPRSSDFGKIKVGDTRFDVTGGMGSLLTLSARLATMSSKSSTSGKVSSLNSGKFGAATGKDVVVDFFENKLSPAASLVKDLLKGEDFNHQKPTLAGEASNLLMPLPVTNTMELWNDPHSANIALATLADALGISVNTYSGKKKKQ